LSVVFSPDGKRLACVEHNGECTMKVWDASTGQELFSAKSRTGHYGSMGFSPDGKRLVGALREGENATVKVWDVQTGQELPKLIKGHTERVRGVVYSADGNRLASASDDGTVKVWDTQTGEELFSSRIGRFDRMEFSPDGKRLVTANSGPWQGGQQGRYFDVPCDVKVWDAETGQELLSLKGFTGPSPRLAFSPNGKRVAASRRYSNAQGPEERGEIKVWDAQTGQELFTLRDTFGTVPFSSDGKRLASSGGGGTVKVWDAQTGQEVFNLKAGGGIDSLAFSPDGHWLVSDPGGTVTIWDATPRPEK
jgi:WD40 repeat protein